VQIDELRYARAHADVPHPKRGSKDAAGIDLGLGQDIRIGPGGHIFLDLGIAFDIPEGCYLSIKPRSNTCDSKTPMGLPSYSHIIVLDNTEGVIDSDYTGFIKVKLTNNGDTTYLGYTGDYILQAVLEEFVAAKELTEVDTITKNTERGSNGFGSTNPSNK